MRQFFTGGEAAFTELEQRARGACVVFANQEMPPDTSATHAWVGFEVRHDGTASLLVDRGITYGGPSRAVQQWFLNGELRFSSFRDLRRFVCQDLAACYGVSHPRQTVPGGPIDATPPVEALIDLDAILAEVGESRTVQYLTEEAVFDALIARVRGQAPALRALARGVVQHLARQSPRRPATFFMVGPTGVGKTKTAESLPASLRAVLGNSNDYGYLRLDMTEYQERHRVSQLLGAPPGYVGYDDGAPLVDTLAANPKTIVLFDEIEKAHPDVLRALMNAMDAGRLSRPKVREASAGVGTGHEIDCRKAIFLFTSNLDASAIVRVLEERGAFDDQVVVDDVCRQHLRAAGVAQAIVGRIGSFLVYRPLDVTTRAEIMALAIAAVAEEYGLRIAYIDPTVITSMLQQVRVEGFGARPDEYLVSTTLGTAFAEAAAARIASPVAVRGGPPFWCTSV